MDFSKFKTNRNKIQEQMSKITKDGSNSSSANMLKLKEGKTQVRIVPYLKNTDNPFVTLKFHYGINNKTLLSPLTFDNPDPIQEFAFSICKDDAMKPLAKKLFLKDTYYAPVIVRDSGEETPQVKWLQLNKTSYETILSYFEDEDYGDIVDVKEGYDLVFEKISAKSAGNDFGKTLVKARTKPTALAETDEEIVNILKTQVDIFELFTEPSYDELKIELDKFMNTSSTVPGESNEEKTETNSDWTSVLPDNPSFMKGDKKTTGSEQKVTSTSSTNDAEKAFNDLFNK